MRKLSVSTLVTLDGVIQDPGGFGETEDAGWANAYFDDEAGRLAYEHLLESDVFLLGRQTYELFKKHWMQVHEGDYAARINSMNGTNLPQACSQTRTMARTLSTAERRRPDHQHRISRRAGRLRRAVNCIRAHTSSSVTSAVGTMRRSQTTVVESAAPIGTVPSQAHLHPAAP